MWHWKQCWLWIQRRRNPHLPICVRHQGGHHEGISSRFVRQTSVLLTAPFAVISLTLLVTAPWIVKLLFGSRYLPVIPLLQILSLSPFLLSLSHNYSTYYMLALGYDRQWSRIVLWSAVLNMLVLFPLLWTIPATYAVAITTLMVDIYSVAAAYLFYRRTEAAR